MQSLKQYTKQRHKTAIVSYTHCIIVVLLYLKKNYTTPYSAYPQYFLHTYILNFSKVLYEKIHLKVFKILPFVEFHRPYFCFAMFFNFFCAPPSLNQKWLNAFTSQFVNYLCKIVFLLFTFLLFEKDERGWRRSGEGGMGVEVASQKAGECRWVVLSPIIN